MNRAFGRTLKAALVALVASASMGALAPNASAAENTWIRNRDSGYCLYGGLEAYVIATACVSGNSEELWDRQGDGTIRKMNTNQCLSQFGVIAIYLECGNSDYQRWNYGNTDAWGNVTVQNRATGNYLVHDTALKQVTVTTYAQWWSFYGG